MHWYVNSILLFNYVAYLKVNFHILQLSLDFYETSSARVIRFNCPIGISTDIIKSLMSLYDIDICAVCQ